MGQERHVRIRVLLPTAESERLLASTGIALDHILYRKGAYAEIEIPDREITLIEASGLGYQVLIEDMAAFYAERNLEKTGQKSGNICYTMPVVKVPDNYAEGSMGGYFTYQEMLDQLDSMTAKYPQLISARQPAGSTLSHQGKPIWWVRISDNAGIDENEPEVLYTALHHAREPVSLSQLIFYMWYLLENYATDPKIKAILNNAELYFMPCLNPDGYLHNEFTNPGGYGMWRKNRRNNANGTLGVDLNRNYGFKWSYDSYGSSPNPSQETYRGPSAFSEPETQAVKSFCESHQFLFALNYHAYGNYVIYPWGYEASLFTPDSAYFVETANQLTLHNHYTFGTGDQTVGYVTNGDSDDWMYGEQTSKNKIFSMTPEVGSAADGFWPAASRILPLCIGNLQQNIMMASLALRHATAEDLSEEIQSNPVFYLPFAVTRLGLQNTSYTITVHPLFNVQSTGPAVTMTGMQVLETRIDSVQVVLPPGLNNGDHFGIVLGLNNGMYTEYDTIHKIFGNPSLAFNSDGNSLSGWTGSWSTTTEDFVSAPSSITDSPGANYSSNTVKTIMLTPPADLSGSGQARLNFIARWDIEKGYDYVQVSASTDGTSWTPLCGKYTVEGTGYQDQGEPVYDGQQPEWVEESMSLDAFAGEEEVYIRFRLDSDAWVNQDGFYFDDLEIVTLPAASTQIAEHKQQGFGFYPNPATNSISLYNLGVTAGEILLFDQTGRHVAGYKVTGPAMDIPVTNLAPGLYHVRCGSFVRQLIIVR